MPDGIPRFVERHGAEDTVDGLISEREHDEVADSSTNVSMKKSLSYFL